MRVALSPKQIAGHGVRHTKLWSALAAVLAATLSAGVLLFHGPHVEAASPTWQSGVYVGGCNTNAINQFKTWRGSNIERGMVFLGQTWSGIENPTSAASCFKTLGLPVTFSVPMLPSSGANIATGATGSYDAHWTNLAKNLVSGGQANADLRIGWEMNGSWFNWSARSNPTAWKNYWIHIVNAMRKVSGQHFTFTWSPGAGQTFAIENAYPGDAYVDYIGLSLYDQYYGPSSASAATRWNTSLNGSHSLAWQASFGAAHNKKLAYPEWALATPSSFTGHGNGDDSYFMQQFYAFLKSHNIAYEIYFDVNHSPNTHQLNSGTSTSGNFKNAGAMYKSLWAGNGNVASSSAAASSSKPTPTPTPTPSKTASPSKTPTSQPTATATPTATKTPSSSPQPTTSLSSGKDVLIYSTVAGRASSRLFNGASITGSAAVWITPSSPASKVSFYLDDTSAKKAAFRVEKDAPFDFAGTVFNGARLYNFGALKAGKHTITAVIALRSGGTKVVTATFTR